jgi:hypothetical protein
VPEPGSEIHAEAEPHEGGREALFLIRGGVGWVAEVGRVSFMPQIEPDFTREGGEWQTAAAGPQGGRMRCLPREHVTQLSRLPRPQLFSNSQEPLVDVARRISAPSSAEFR